MAKPIAEILLPKLGDVRPRGKDTSNVMREMQSHIAALLNGALEISVAGEMASLPQTDRERVEAEYNALSSFHANMTKLARLDKVLGEFLEGKQRKSPGITCTSGELVDYTGRTALALIAQINKSTQSSNFKHAMHGSAEHIASLCDVAAENLLHMRAVQAEVGMDPKTLLQQKDPWEALFCDTQIARLDHKRVVPNYRPQLRKIILAANAMEEMEQFAPQDERSAWVHRRLGAVARGTIIPPLCSYTTGSLLMPDSFKETSLMKQLSQQGLPAQVDALFTKMDRIMMSYVSGNFYHYAIEGMHVYHHMRNYYRKAHDIEMQAAEVVAELRAKGEIGCNEPKVKLSDAMIRNVQDACQPFLERVTAYYYKESTKEKPDAAALETIQHTECAIYALLGDLFMNDKVVQASKGDVETLYGLWSAHNLSHDPTTAELQMLANESGLSDALLPLFSRTHPVSVTGLERGWEQIAEAFNHLNTSHTRAVPALLLLPGPRESAQLQPDMRDGLHQGGLS